MRTLRAGMLRRTALLLAVAVVAVGCTGDSPARSRPVRSEPAPPVILFVQDGEAPDVLGAISPAFLGLRLGLEQGSSDPPEVRVVDAASTDDLATALDDEGVRIVVIGPFTPTPDSVTTTDRTVLSLSALGPPLSGTWRRPVPGLSAHARVLAEAARALPHAARHGCWAGDGGTWSERLGRTLPHGRYARIESTDAAAQVLEIASTGCRVVAWTGYAPGAAALRVRLDASALSGVRLALGAAARTQAYLDLAGEASTGTVAGCPCVDADTGTDPGTAAFVHEYQSATGLAPGPFAAEAFDLGGALGTDPRSCLTGYEGIAGPVRYDSGGTLTPALDRSLVERARGGRWVPV